MTTAIIIIAMLLSFGLGAYTATKTLQMGLKYKMDIEEGIKPELNPIEKIVERERERKEVEKVNNLTQEMLNDIMGGTNET